MKKVISFVLIIIVGFGGFIFWQKFLHQDEVKLYFATQDGMNLQAECRKVKGDIILSALNELIAGPTNPNLMLTIPPKVEVLNVKVQNGLCTVNFNQKLSTDHWGGSTGEMLTVYSIVNTLAQFPSVERVQILIEGRKVETLSGHLILYESLEPDEELVK